MKIKTQMLKQLGSDVLGVLTEKDAQHVSDLLSGDHSGNWAMVAHGDGALLGLAVIGLDSDGMVTVYFARSFMKNLGPPSLKAFLFAAQMTGRPFRVHSERIAVLARSIGLDVGEFSAGVDGDGLPMLMVGADRGQ